MAETRGPASQSGTRGVVPRRRERNRTTERIIGSVYIAVAVALLIFGLVTWAIGRLNPINALVFAIGAVGTLPIGLLALRGDYVGTRGMDEGQREMYRAAQADAFYVAYFGLFALFLSNILWPWLLAQAQVETGVLLLLIVMTWLVSYMWRRWRP